jgi:hypothetical protein
VVADRRQVEPAVQVGGVGAAAATGGVAVEAGLVEPVRPSV